MRNIIRKIKKILKRFYKKLFKNKLGIKKLESLLKPEKSGGSTVREEVISMVMEKTGWNRECVKNRIEEARKKTGISYSDYNKYNFFSVPEENQIEEWEKICKRKENRALEKQKAYIDEVVRQTGWDAEFAEEEMKKSKEATGASFEHYAIYRFWELDEATQKTFFSKGDADKLRKIYNQDKEILQIFMNKDLFYSNFKKYIGRPWMKTKNISLSEFKRTFAKEKKVIYKPRASSGGRNIQVFDFSELSMEAVYGMLCELPDGVIEGYVEQHSEMKRLFPNSVNTIRVVTIQTNRNIPGVEKNKVHFVYAGVRMGQGNSYVDNLHSGGMMAILDLNTGKIVTDAVDFKSNVFSKHPDTGTVIKGFTVPYFKELKALIETAGKGINAYLGWDIAITENGPIIIEVNTHPGADGLQTPFVPEKRGMRHVIEKYLVEPNVDYEPEFPYGTKISGITKEGIEFYWKKLERVNGYEVFRSYSIKGPFKRIAVIEKRNIGTYMDADFDHQKKRVYYCVRSYLNTPNGERVYSKKTQPTEAAFRKELTLERDFTYLYSGDSRHIRAFYGWGEVSDASWESNNTNVAIVTADGTIKAIASGECTLICSSKKLGKKAETRVIVDREACEPLTEIRSRFQYNEKRGIWENKDAASTNDAVIMMVGDMMCGKMQMQVQYTQKEGWNFNDSYEFVKEITAESDFAIGNLETLLAAGWPYMLDETYIENMNNCNATSRYLDAVRYGGFDAVAMANNHNCDGGKKALIETIEQVDKYQLARTGVFYDCEDRRFLLVNVNGIKIGYLAYISESTGFNGKDRSWEQNDKDILLNIFSKEKAEKDISACRAAGAEYVIVYMHWGYKNHRKVAAHQIKEAQEVADAGADYIVGGNPHVIQKYDVINTKDGRVVPCIYSTGNFQAVMKQIKENRDSVMIRIRLKKDETGKIVLEENNYIPFYTYTNCMKSNWAPVALSNRYNTRVLKKNKEIIRNRIAEYVGDKISMLK